jgi:hypothetical protein
MGPVRKREFSVTQPQQIDRDESKTTISGTPKRGKLTRDEYLELRRIKREMQSLLDRLAVVLKKEENPS